MLKILENFEWKTLYSDAFDYEVPIETDIEPVAEEGYRWIIIIPSKTMYNWKLQYDENANLEPYETFDGNCMSGYRLSIDGTTCEPLTNWQDVSPSQTQWAETQPIAGEDFRWLSFDSIYYPNTWGIQKLVQGSTYGSGEWVSYENLIPFGVNTKKDESLDTAVISRLTKIKKVYRPLTRVKIVDGADVKDFLVENCSCNKIAPNLYKQTFELIEPTESLKGYIMDNLTFTQPINPDALHSKKTLGDIILRMFMTTIKNWASYFVVDIPDEFYTIESPELFFTEMTMFDGKIEIGSFTDTFPRVFITDNGALRLTFEPLDVPNKTNYIVDDYIVEEYQQPLNNYGESAVSNISNLSLENTIVYPSNGLGLRVNARGNASKITDSNAVFTLPNRIKKIVKLEMRTSLANDWTDYTSYLYEKSEWMLLNPFSLNEQAGSPPEKERQPHTCWYIINTYDIEFGEFFVLKPDIRGIRVRVTYIPLDDKRVRIDNVDQPQFTLINNQNENIVEGKSVARKLSNYIKRMQYGDLIISKKYKTLADMPVLGHLINNQYVLTNLSYTKYHNHYDVTMQLSEGYTRRAEFIRAKQEIRSWEIPADGKVVNRDVNQNDIVKLSLGKPLAKNNNTSITKIEEVLTVLHYEIDFQGTFAVVNFETLEGTLPLMFVASVGSMENNLLLSFRTIDNVLAGFSKATSGILEKVEIQTGVTYTDSFGEFDTATIGLLSNFEDLISSDEFAINYPLSTLTRNNNLLNRSYIKLDNKTIQKDAREKISFTYQLTLKGVNGTVVNNSITRNALYQNHKSWSLYAYFLKKKIYNENQQINWQAPGDIDEYVITGVLVKDANVIGNKISYELYNLVSNPIPSDFVAVAIGYNQLLDANDRFHHLTVVQNEITEIKSDIIEFAKIDLYMDY